MDFQDASSSPTATDATATGATPIARPDVDALAPGSSGPATGNTITGIGTVTGSAGADSPGDGPSSIVAVQGAGGAGTASGGGFQASGQYGVLNIDTQGNFSYVRNAGTPDGVQDVFGYTLADSDGSTSSSTLTIEIGEAGLASADGVINLPAGVELSDVRVRGSDLVITMPDGSEMVIPGGAVFVPQLVIGDVQVPASNLAALLIDAEAPRTAASPLQSSGGNFGRDVPPLDPGVPLGDLLPPTSLAFPPIDLREIGQFIDEDVEAGITAAEVDDDEQAGGNPGGIGDDPFGSTDSGFLPASGGDGDLEWALLTTGAPTGFSYSAGPNGSVLVFQNGNPNAVLRIDVNPATGAYTVTQLGPIAHPAGGDENNLNFPISYSVTDEDGDTDVGTLNVDVDDDTPIARDDTDALASGQISTDGNVITAVGTTSAPGSADSPGADGLGSPTSATDGVTGIRPTATATFTDIGAVGVTVNGQFGSLLMNPNGSYVYTRFENARQGGTDVFVYRIIDGDGDTTTATLTITVPADPVPIPAPATAIVDDDGLVAGDQDDGAGDDVVPDNDGDGSQATFRGTLTANFGGQTPGTFTLAAMHNQTATIGQETVRYSWNDATDTLTAEIISSPDASRVETNLFQVVLQPGGQFDVTLLQNVLHTDQGTPPAFENDETAVLTFTATDSNNDSTPGTLTITFDDDIPTALPPNPPGEPGDPTTPLVGGLVDEDDLPNGNNDDAPGDDDPVDASGDGDATTTGDGAGSLAALFDAGADEPLTFTLSEDTSALEAQNLTANGKPLVYDVNVATGVLTAVADLDGDGTIEAGETIFTLTVNEDGSWLFNLEGQLDHSVPNFEDNIDIDFSSMIIATDADGDEVTAAAGAFVVTVDDDVPTAKPPIPPEGQDPPTPLITGLVDEDDLPTGNHDNQDGDDDPGNLDGDDDGTTTGSAAANLTALFNAGADQPLTILLSEDTSALEAQNLKSQGADVVYDVNVETGVLTGYAESGATAGFQAGEDRIVFTLTVDSATGAWEFDLVDQLDHSVPGTEDNILIDFSSSITAVDADGDTVTAAPGVFVINVDDDMPKEFVEPCPEVNATNVAGTVVEDISLDLPPVGADEPGTVSFGVEDGDPVLDTDGKQLSSDGNLLFYFVDGNVLEARETNASGDVVFRITLNGDGTFTYEQIEDITSTTTLSIVDLSSVGGGNVDAKAIDVPDTQFDLILTTQVGNTVNTNATEMGVGGGNSLEAGEHIRIDLVQNAFVTGSGGGAVLNFGEYYTATAYRQDVSGLGGPQRADFIVRAIVVNEAPGSDPADPADGDNVFYGDTNDTFVAVTTLNIYDDNGVLVDPADYAGLGIAVAPAVGGGWTITGLPNDFDFEILSATPFNAVQVEAIAGTDTFKLGFIDITSIVQTDVAFEVPIVFTDFDGDPVLCDILVDLGAPSNTPDVTILVDEAALNSVGSNPGSTAETQGGDLDDVVTGGTPPYTYQLIGPNADGVSPYGNLTLNSDGSYSFTLTAPFDSQPDADDGTNVEAGVVVYTYQATDDNGVTSTGEIRINIRDDVPTADDDVDSIASGESGPATGNVITGVDIGGGDSNTTDGDADTVGADQPGRVTHITFNATTLVVPNGGSVAIDGDHGTLTIFSNGNYSYVREDGSPGDAQDVFTYTLVDADGDTDQATLTITIEDAGVTVSIPNAEATNHVYENALGTTPQGTSEAAAPGANDDPNEVVTGTITFTAEDGLGSITIGTTTLNLAGPYPQTVADDATGKLEVLGVTYDAATGNGSIDYRYTLEDNTLGNQAVNGGNTTVSFAVDIEDGDGDHSPPGNLVITIVDDAPIANDDGPIAVAEDTPATFGVFGNDLFGADDVDTDNNPAVKVTFTQGTKGTVSYNATTGEFTYTPNAGASGADSFTYTITDGDGDQDTATVTLNIAQDSVPDIKTPQNVSVDEDGLAGANVDNGEPGEVNHGNDDTGTGTVVVDFGGDRPGNDQTAWLNAIDFINVSSLNGQLTQDGQPITFALNGAGAIEGKVNGAGLPVITISFTAAVAGSGGNVTYTYTVELDGPVDQATGSGENSITLTGVQFNVTDSDGDSDPVAGSFDVTVWDDVPTARNDGTINVPEDGQTTFAVFTNDSFGADGVDTDNNPLPASVTWTNPTKGSVSYNTVTGQFTYTANTGAEGADSFTYTIIDADGDQSTATVNLLIAADSVPDIKTPQNVAVDEDGLATAVVDTGQPGEVTNSNDDTGTGTVVVDYGNDRPGNDQTAWLNAIDFVNPTALNGQLTQGGQPITFSIDGSGNLIGQVNGAGPAVITISFTGAVAGSGGNVTYTYTVELDGPVDQGGVNSEGSVTLTGVQFNVTDDEGDTDPTPGSFNVTIHDDIPSDFTPDEAIMENTGTDSFTGKLDTDDTIANNDGADGLKSLVWNIAAPGTPLLNTDGDPVTVNGQPVLLYVQPDGSLKATTDNSSAAATVFTATLAPGTSDYTITFLRALDNGSTSASDFSSLAAGNTPWKGLDTSKIGTVHPDIADPADPNPDSVDLLFTPIGAATINTDADDIGTGGGQKVNPNEALRVDMVQDLRRDPGQDESDAGGYLYDTHVGQVVFTFKMVDVQGNAAQTASVLIQAWNVNDGSATAQSNVNDAGINTAVEVDPSSIEVRDSGGNLLTLGVDYFVHDSGTGVFVSGLSKGDSVTFRAVGDATFEAVTIENATGDLIPGGGGTTFGGQPFGLGGFVFGTADAGDPVAFELPVLLTDGDNDTSDGTVAVTVYPVGEAPALTSFATTESQELYQSFRNANNAALLGAIAAAGLAAEPLAAEETNNLGSGDATDESAVAGPTLVSDSSSVGGDSPATSVDAALDAAAGNDEAVDSTAKSSANEAARGGVTGAEDAPAPAEADLPQGTEMPAAEAVSMPAAEPVFMVAPTVGDENGGGVQHNAIVGRVLVDAMNGGDGPDLNALINAVAGDGAAGANPVATLEPAFVPTGDTADIASFTGNHMLTIMEQMAVHQDAAPANG